MAISPKDFVLSSNQDGVLEVFYNIDSTKYRLDKFSVTKKDKITNFALEKIWVNKQPAQYLGKFKTTVLEKSYLDGFKIEGDELFLNLNSEEKISLKITYTEPVDDDDNTREIPSSNSWILINVSFNLKIEGLKKILEKRFNFSNFDIRDEKNCSLSGSLRKIQLDKSDPTVTLVFNEEKKTTLKENLLEGGNGIANKSLPKTPFNNFEMPVLLNFSKNAPKWRYIVAGLNFLGKCQTKGCPAEKDNPVCIQKGFFDEQGFNEFHLSEHRFKCLCPKCGNKVVEVTNCIFFDCIYSIEGMKENEKELFKINKQKAPKDRALFFVEHLSGDPDPTSNVVMWSYLKIKIENPPTSQCKYL
jgi:hypothetical protein